MFTGEKKMIFDNEKYHEFLQCLSKNLEGKLSEDEVGPKDEVQEVVERVMIRFKQGLESNQRAKEDFINTYPRNWGDKIMDPITNLACTYFKTLLSEGGAIKQKESFEDVSLKDKLTEQIEAYMQKKEKLLRYIDMQKKIKEEENISDDDSLYLEEE